MSLRSYTQLARSYLTSWNAAPALTCLVMLGIKSLSTSQREGETVVEDHIQRNSKIPRPWPTSIFCFIRLFDPLACWWALRRGHQGSDSLTQKDWLFLLMVATGALRHVYWAAFLNEHEWTWPLSISVGVFNNWFDFTHTQCRRISQLREIGPLSILGAVLFGVGSIIETASETQRRLFRRRPENEGKLYTLGLFRYARHINYLGYVMWRTGLGLVSGPPHSLCYGLYHAHDFYARGIPLLGRHMEKKYGEAWKKYERDTPYVLIPGLL